MQPSSPNSKFNSVTGQVEQAPAVPVVQPNEVPAPVSTDRFAELNKQIELEDKYGDNPVEAALTGAARGATFGLSDAALRAAGVSAERLQQVEELNPTIAKGSEVAGIIASALASGGTGVAAKSLGAGAKALGAAGSAVERAALAGAEQVAGAGLAAKTAGLIARGATEGAIIGVGDTISDAALGREDLAAESLLANATHGAIMGGGIGLATGTALASGKLLKKGAKAVGQGIKNRAADIFAPLYDQETQILQNVANPGQVPKLKKRLGKYADELPKYYEENLQASVMDSAADRVALNEKTLEAAGTRVKEAIKTVEPVAATVEARREVYDRLATELEKQKSILKEAGAATNRAEIRELDAYLKDAGQFATQKTPFSLEQLNTWRDSVGKKLRLRGSQEDSAVARAAETLYPLLRQEIDSVVARADSTAGFEFTKQLLEDNKRLHIGLTIRDFLEKKAAAAPDISTKSFTGLVTGASIDMARNAAIKYNLAKKVLDTTKTLDEEVVAAVKPGKVKKFSLPATTILTVSDFAMGDTGQKPKNTQQAFENISSNLNKLQNPDTLVDVVAKKTARVTNATPGVAAAMQERLATGVQFLNSKLPRVAVNPGVFSRPHIPSSLELAKFSRYLQAVEQPLSVLQELKQGTLTREHVEALQVVYPELYKEIQFRVMSQIQEDPSAIPYSKKVQLGILLGVPADSSLQPENLMQLQQSISMGSDQPDSMSPATLSPRAKGLDQLESADRTMTGTQAIEALD